MLRQLSRAPLLRLLPPWHSTAFAQPIERRELSALERGIHALHATEKGSKLGRSVAAYAKEIGRPGQTVAREVAAAAVYEAVSHQRETADIPPATHLAEIHAAPRWLWHALVEKLETESLMVVRLRDIVSELKGVPEPLLVFDTDRIAERIVARTMKPSEVGAMNDTFSRK